MKQDKSTPTNSTEDFNNVIAMRDNYKACAAYYKKKLAETRDELAKEKHNSTKEIEHLREQVDDLITDNIRLRKKVIILDRAVTDFKKNKETKSLPIYEQLLAIKGFTKFKKELGLNDKDSHD